MQQIIQTLEMRKEQLRRSALCAMIADNSLPPESRLSFTPVLLFFVMGFKDILHTLQDEKSTDPMQQSVNIHCEEDSFHWQWYLKDLERLSHGKNFLNLPRAKAFELVWTEEYRPVRSVVYESIHLARLYFTPFYKLVMIEALEATFECFNEPVFQLVHDMGKADELEYFGQLHAHSEASHAMEKTSEDHESAAYNNYQPSEHESRTAVHIINRVFDSFEKVFDCWQQAAVQQNNSVPA